MDDAPIFFCFFYGFLKRLSPFRMFHETFMGLHLFLVSDEFVEAGGGEAGVEVELDERRKCVWVGVILKLWLQLWLQGKQMFWDDYSVFGLTILFLFGRCFSQFREEEEVSIVRIPATFGDCFTVGFNSSERFLPSSADEEHDISWLER